MKIYFMGIVVPCLLCIYATTTTCFALAEGRCVSEVSLEEIRARIVGSSPVTAEVDKEYALDLAAAIERESLSNPELQFERTRTRMFLGGADDDQTNAALGMMVRLSDLGARQRVAQLMRQVGDQKRSAALFEAVQRGRLAFIRLYALQESERITVEAAQRSRREASVVKEGVRKGLFSSGDEELLVGEAHRLEALAVGMVAELRSTQRDLAKLVGSACELRVKKVSSLPPVPAIESLLATARASTITEAGRYDLALRLATEQLDAAKLDRIPGVSPRILYQHTNDGGDFVGAGITIPLPFFNRNEAAILRANAEAEALKAKEGTLRGAEFAQQVELLRLAAQQSASQAEIYRVKVIPAFERAHHAQEKLYADGRGSVVQVWQTLRELTAARLEGLQRAIATEEVRVQLSIMVGEEV